MIEWIATAGQRLGFHVETERRRKTHGKIFQIDTTWFKAGQLTAFVEAEKRWDINHIIGHLACCADFAHHEQITPYFLLVFLENAANHSNRLRNTWTWLQRLVPPSLEVRDLPIYLKKNDPRPGLHASTITMEEFTAELDKLVGEPAL
jgi:hypothetical protein